MGGAQFALPGAVDRLRSLRDTSPRSWPGAAAEAGQVVHVLAATDPANAYGLSLPWPLKGPSRTAGAYVVLIDGIASLYLERGQRGLSALRDLDGTWEATAVRGLEWLLGSGRLSRLSLQRYPEGLADVLRGAGFTPTPKGLVLYA
jgi:ATP-dependent Lhr-like helicase